MLFNYHKNFWISRCFLIKEFCTALPAEGNKADPSIRLGFSWLIRTIENDYDKINSRVNNSKTPRQVKPIDRKPQINNKSKNE